MLDKHLAGQRLRDWLARSSRLGDVQWWTAVAITVACLVHLASSAQLPSLQDAARRASYGSLLVALCLSLLSIVCKAARWRVLYPYSGRPTLGLAVTGIAVGQVANWAVPTRLGEAIRVGLVSSSHPGTGASAGRAVGVGVGVLLLEKLLDGFMLLVMVAIVSLLVELPGWLSILWVLALASACMCGLLVAVGVTSHPNRCTSGTAIGIVQRLPRALRRLLQQTASVADEISAWLSPAVAAQALLWSVAAWCLGAAVNFCVLSSLGLDLGPGAALVVLVALMGGAVIPALPTRVGVFQYLCVLALLPFGLSFDQALAFSLALYAVVYLPPIALGLIPAVLLGPAASRHAARLIRRAGSGTSP
jgi:uncharacterized protein (TIRG00374 family)